MTANQILVRFISHKLVRDASLVTGANLARTASVFLGWIVLARILPPTEFGVFALTYSTMSLVAQLSESGLGIGIVKLLSQAPADDVDTQDALRGSFLTRMAVTAVAVGILLLGADWVAVNIFHNASIATPMRLAAWGALGSSYFAFILSCFQGLKRFVAYAAVSGLSGAIWILGLTGLQFSSSLTVESALLLAGSSFALPAVLGHMRLGTRLIRLPQTWASFRQLMKFSKWTALSGFLVLLIMQGDVFLLSYLSTISETGVYSAGQRLAMSISVLTNSVLTVMLPNVLAQTDVSKLKQGLFKSLRLVVLAPLILMAAYSLAPHLIYVLYGEAFTAAAPVFTILFGALLLSIFTNSLGFIYYSLNRPQVITLSLAFQLASLVIACSVLAPSHGAVGVALSVGISRAIGFLATLIPLFFSLRNPNEVQVA